MKRNWGPAHAKVEREGRCRAATDDCSGPVDPHHVVPRSRVSGPEVDAESNIVPLCRYHHDKAHSGLLDLLPHLSRDEQAYVTFLVGWVEAGRYMTGKKG